MELRITGYTRAGLVPILEAKDTHDDDTTKRNRPHTHMRTRYFRPPPIIHFTGSSIGSDRRLDDGRTVKGSVGLIGGGEVRWQMVSLRLRFLSFSVCSSLGFISSPSSCLSSYTDALGSPFPISHHENPLSPNILTQDIDTQDTFVPGSSTPEWSSEAVQIGGVGSALGLLGMWTGARHQRADPLGEWLFILYILLDAPRLVVGGSYCVSFPVWMDPNTEFTDYGSVLQVHSGLGKSGDG
jgi:hypothetical protein